MTLYELSALVVALIAPGLAMTVILLVLLDSDA